MIKKHSFSAKINYCIDITIEDNNTKHYMLI